MSWGVWGTIHADGACLLEGSSIFDVRIKGRSHDCVSFVEKYQVLFNAALSAEKVLICDRVKKKKSDAFNRRFHVQISVSSKYI